MERQTSASCVKCEQHVLRKARCVLASTVHALYPMPLDCRIYWSSCKTNIMKPSCVHGAICCLYVNRIKYVVCMYSSYVGRYSVKKCIPWVLCVQEQIALHGCHLAKSRLPVTPSSFKISTINMDIHFTTKYHKKCQYQIKHIVRHHQVCTTTHVYI